MSFTDIVLTTSGGTRSAAIPSSQARRSIGLVMVVLASAACGRSNTPAQTIANNDRRAVSLEWTATHGDGDNVEVVLRIEGTPAALGTPSAASTDAPGTPKTC